MNSPWKDKDGQTVIFQKPNLLLKVWAASYLITKLPLTSQALNLVSAFSFGALFAWTWMEIFSGVNLFRRGLGVVVMIVILAGKFK